MMLQYGKHINPNSICRHAQNSQHKNPILEYMFKGGTVYILSFVSKRTIYTGVTSDLERRMYEHKSKAFPDSFSAKYNCCQLVYYKHFGSIEEAIAEEKRIKGAKRRQKDALISSINPQWADLSLTVTDWWPEQ